MNDRVFFTMIAASALALPLSACGAALQPTNTSTADNAAAATVEAPAKPASTPTAPQADKWAGEYQQPTSEDGHELTITANGPGRYKVNATWGGMTAGGNYNSDGWEGTGEANGDLLTIRESYMDQPVSCTLHYLPGPKPAYRMTGCGPADGTYRRTKIGAAVAAPAPITRAAPVTRATLVGAWVYVETGCETDTGLFLNEDGSWSRNDHNGPWTLNGPNLRLVTTELRYEDEVHAVKPATIERYTVRKVTADRMTLVTPNRSVENYMRCR